MVSVIIPAYNVEKYLSRAVRSVQDSSFRDFELIIVDDGSTDSTGVLADDFARNDERIKVIHTINGGAAHARMAGVSAAINEYVIFVDADDTIESHAIEWLLRYADDDISVVVGGIKRVTPEGEYLIKAPCEGIITEKRFIDSLLAGELLPTMCGKLFRRKDLQTINAHIDAEIRLNEDFLMLVAVVHPLKTLYVHTEHPIYNYYYRGGSATDAAVMSFRGWLKLVNGLRPYIDNNEAFFRYRLRRIYDCCITRGARFSHYHPEVRRLVADSRKYFLTAQERRVLWMLRSRVLRAIVARRHRRLKPQSQVIISVVMASYNQPRLIAKAIRSVISQSFHDWELVVVDDCSLDETADVVKSFAAVDSRIRLLKTRSNIGQGGARLLGVAACRGEFVTFIDQDDLLSREALAKMWQRMVYSDADIIVMGSRRMSRHGWLKIPLFSPERYFRKPRYKTLDLLPELLRRDGFPCTQWDKLYRRSLIGSVDKYDLITVGEDFAFNFETFMRGGNVGWVDYAGYKWRAGGQSSMAYPQRWEANLEIYRNMLRIMKKHHVDDTHALRKALDEGLVNDLLDKIARALRQQWRGGLKTFIDSALQTPELRSALENTGVDASFENLMKMGKEWRGRHRLFYFVSRLMDIL